jgi:hypothetical protein
MRLLLMFFLWCCSLTADASPEIYKYYLSWGAFIPNLTHHNKLGIVDFDQYPSRFYDNTLGVAYINRFNPYFNRVEIDLRRIYIARVHPNFIVLHEYLHLMYIDHVEQNQYLEDGCVKYLMNTTFGEENASIKCWHDHKEYYMKQFEDWRFGCSLIKECITFESIFKF